jgi:hypothetical protein
MEVWWIGQDGSVQDRWFSDADWHGFEMAPAGSASLSSGLTALAREHDRMEVWWIGQNGSVQDRWFY